MTAVIIQDWMVNGVNCNCAAVAVADVCIQDEAGDCLTDEDGNSIFED